MAETPVPPENRGGLSIDDRVGDKIAERAALAVKGVIRHQSGGLGSLIGGTYPKADVDLSPGGQSASVGIAIGWPSPITRVCREVQAKVADDLERLTGIRPTRVDVHVAAVVAASTTPNPAGDRPGFVELPAPTETLEEV